MNTNLGQNRYTSEIGTAKVTPRLNVTQAIIGKRSIRMSIGATDVDADRRIAPYVGSPNWTWGYAGTKEAATLIVVTVRYRAGEAGRDPWTRAAAQLAKLQAKHGGAVR